MKAITSKSKPNADINLIYVDSSFDRLLDISYYEVNFN
jgi:hypothetical protein